MTERFIVDDAGTLIDMQTRDMFDIVEEVCPLLNILADENEQLKERNDFLRKQLDRVCIDNETMGDKLKQIGRIL